MIKYIQKLKHKKGFTLVEMVVVMAIISFLGSILIPQLTQYVTLARVTAVNATASTIRKTIQGYMLDMSIKNLGLKRSGNVGGTPLTITAQIIWSVNNYNWMVKTECKPCYWNGSKWADNKMPAGKSKEEVCFNDHKNWYSANFKYVGDNVTINDKNHLMALSVSVRQCLPDLRTGLVLACFEAGICKGIIYIPDWNYKWPNSPYPSTTYTAGMRNQTARPKVFQSNRWGSDEQATGAGAYVSSECMMEFSPWHGVWPREADDRTWAEGVAGLQVDGFYVGTSPAIAHATGRRDYTKDWGAPIA